MPTMQRRSGSAHAHARPVRASDRRGLVGRSGRASAGATASPLPPQAAARPHAEVALARMRYCAARRNAYGPRYLMAWPKGEPSEWATTAVGAGGILCGCACARAYLYTDTSQRLRASRGCAQACGRSSPPGGCRRRARSTRSRSSATRRRTSPSCERRARPRRPRWRSLARSSTLVT